MDKNDFALSLVMNSVVHQEVKELDSPHVVVCREMTSGRITLSGPFPGGLQALLAADAEHTSVEESMRSAFEFSVAPLLPPFEQTAHQG